jgi:cytochrome c
MEETTMRTFVLGAMLVVASTGASFAQSADDGMGVFQRFCSPCHDVGPGARVKLGPPLNGLDGRKAGSFEGFNYSDVMKNANVTWNEAQFKEFIRAPQMKFPGTRMAFTGLKEDADVNNIWAYLVSFGPNGDKK